MNYRKKIYYPDSQIQKKLYTQGKEWMELENWGEYRGYYHKYITGEVFTESEWNPKTSKKLVPYKNRSKMFFLPSVLNDPNFLNSYLPMI